MAEITRRVSTWMSAVCCIQAEKKVKELQNELDDLSQRLDEAGGATQAQVTKSRIHASVH